MSKPRPVFWISLLALWLAVAGGVHAAEVIPAKPTRYFNDYALSVKPQTAEALNQKLVALEQQTSDQVLVVVYPTMQTDSSVDDYCLRVYRSWQVGQKDKNNGAVLFVFLKEHKLWIQTGRGLEGGLPDATCKDITADVIAPRFKAGDIDGGLTAGVDAMITAINHGGDYKGDGQTDYQKQHPAQDGTSTGSPTGGGFSFGALVFILIVFFIISRFSGRGGGAGMLIGGALSGLGGGGFGGGGGGFGGGGGGGGGGGDSGGFSSGGGDTGGGGAGSSW